MARRWCLTWGASSLRAGGPACFSPLSRNDRMPLGCPAVPGAEFSVAGFASGAFAMQPRNGPIPVLDGPQRARARAASDAGGLENSDWIHAQGWVRWGRSAGVSAVVALMVFATSNSWRLCLYSDCWRMGTSSGARQAWLPLRLCGHPRAIWHVYSRPCSQTVAAHAPFTRAILGLEP